MVRATIVTESRFESMDSEVLSSDNTATKEGMVKATAEAKQNLDPIIVVVDSEEELVRTTFTVKELAEGDSKTKNSSNRVAGQSMLQLVSVEEKVDKVVAVGTTIGFDFSKGERILGPLLLEGKRRTMQDTMLSLQFVVGFALVMAFGFLLGLRVWIEVSSQIGGTWHVDEPSDWALPGDYS
ncbi:hypothetical protein QYF36_013394 [Acer negundo]|nr:hypothetical protein QYF36_013394 [Acer negundo]